jgi:transcriptional regulator with XRE-family HTH domain
MLPDDAAGWFGVRLKELRVVAGLTQPELAELAGMAKAGIANLEQGRTSPAWETVVRLCRALGVKCDAFLEPPADMSTTARGRPPKSTEGDAPTAGDDAPAAKPARPKGKGKGDGRTGSQGKGKRK